MSTFTCTNFLKALADHSRWRIVQHLLGVERASGFELVEALEIPQPSVSKHLRVLRQAGIVSTSKEKTTLWCSIPSKYRRQDVEGAFLDLGCCSFRFEAPEPPEKSLAGSAHQ